MKNIILIILLFFNFTSCLKEKKNSPIDFKNFNYDTLKISIEPEYIGDNAYGSTILETNKKTLFACYNRFDHAIEVYDLKNKNPIKKIKLEKQGPNKLKLGIYSFLNDSVFINKTQRQLALINGSGQIINSIPFNKIKGINHTKYTFTREGIHIGNFDQLCIDTSQNFILVTIYKTIRKKKTKEFHDSYFISKIYWDENRGEILPIKYPEIFRRKNFGDLDYPDFCIKDNSIIYSFRNSSDIYKWKENQKKLYKYQIECKNANGLSQPLAMNHKNIMPSIKSSKYYRVIYDKYRDIFYRIYKEENKQKNSKALSGNYHLIILTNEFEKLKEIPLGKDIYPFSAHVTKKGLIFALKAKEMKQMNCMRFLVMKPNIIN